MRFSRLVAGVCLACTLASPSHAGDGAAGDWQGDYVCNQGRTGLELVIKPGEGTTVNAVFRFRAVPSNPRVPDGCFEMAGDYEPASRRIMLHAGHWLLQPYGYVTVDLSGSIDASGKTMAGAVQGPNCTRFAVRRLPPGPRTTPVACHPADVVVSLFDADVP